MAGACSLCPRYETTYGIACNAKRCPSPHALVPTAPSADWGEPKGNAVKRWVSRSLPSSDAAPPIIERRVAAELVLEYLSHQCRATPAMQFLADELSCAGALIVGLEPRRQ